MVIKNPQKITIEELNLQLTAFCKSKLIKTLFGKKVILSKYKTVQHIIIYDYDSLVKTNPKTPLWWSLMITAIGVLAFMATVFFSKNFEKDIVIAGLFFLLTILVNQHLFLLIYSEKIKEFRVKLEETLK